MRILLWKHSLCQTDLMKLKINGLDGFRADSGTFLGFLNKSMKSLNSIN